MKLQFQKKIFSYSPFLAIILMIFASCSEEDISLKTDSKLSNTLASSHFSKTQIITFQKTLGGSGGDGARSVKQTSDGGFIIAGSTNSSDGDVSSNLGSTDYWIVKMGDKGNIEWETTAGGTRHEVAHEVIETRDHGYAVIGTSFSEVYPFFLNNQNQYGLGEALFLKFNSFGTRVGGRKIGGLLNDSGKSLAQTEDGGYVIGGQTESHNGNFSINRGQIDMFVAKLSPVYFGHTAIETLKTYGGSQYETAESVVPTYDGGYIVTGRSGSSDGDVGMHLGSQDFWVLKLDALLNISWKKVLGGSNHDIAYEIKETPDFGYVIAGSSRSSNGDVINNRGDFDYWITKLSINGDLEWQQTFGGSGEDQARSIDLTSDGGYIISGHSNSKDIEGVENRGLNDFLIVKLNIKGDFEWQKALGGSGEDRSFSIRQTSDGGYVTAGTTESSDYDVTNYKGGGDVWIVKLDQFGNLN